MAFIFDPAEFEVLETFDFEEEIQRPVELRFFTIEEQLVDFFEKHLPPGKPTKFELNALKDYQYRLKTAYNKLITVSDTEYIVDTARTSVSVPWIHSVYEKFEYRPYSFTKEYAPLFDKAARSKPNFYPLLINSLPSPYSSSEGRPLDGNLELVDEEGKNPVRGLLKYKRTKNKYFDDGSFDLIDVSIPNSADDDLKIKGYFLDPHEVHNPIDHPFLSTKTGFIQSDVPLITMYPSIGAIMEHAIPTTTDPYETGMKFLKLYDVSIANIPWSEWKRRFPPVDPVLSANITQLVLPKIEEQSAPSEILQKIYSKWHPGYHQRYWLSMQIDTGLFIQQLLLSDSSKNGVVAPSIEGPSIGHPEGQREICMALTSDFDSFLSSGLYRPKRDKNGFDVGGVCVPVGAIQQEKSRVYNRLVWKETTENDIQQHHTRLLKLFKEHDPKEVIVYEKFGKMPDSEQRQDILNILRDENRTPEDKADSIELLARNTVLVGKIYTDAQSRFIVCLHTINLLCEGENQEFYREWTNIRDGARVCKYCDEVVFNEVLQASDEYDDDGHLIVSREVLEDRVQSAPMQLKNIFDLNNSGESVLYLLITLLQVTPYEQQVLPVLHLIRRITQSLKTRAQSSGKISKSDQERIEGILGVCGMVILLQVHNPFLIPKKSVGNKLFNTSGYPRDSEDPQDSPVLDSILIVLKKTFESYHSELKGGIGALSSQITKISKIKQESAPYLKVFSDQFKLLLESAKDRYVIPEEIELNELKFPILRPEASLKLSEVPEGERVVQTVMPNSNWTNKNPISFPVPIKLDHLNPSPQLTTLSTNITPIQVEELTEKEVQALVKEGLPAGFPIISEFMKVENDVNSFRTVVSRLLDILATSLPQTFQTKLRTRFLRLDFKEPSLLRDIAKGSLFQLLHEVKKEGSTRLVNEALKNDLTLKMVLLSQEKAEKEEFTLRTNETNLLKQRYREMSDTQREITKMLVDIGIADFIITNEDRLLFAKKSEKDAEREYNELEAQSDVHRPEEGYDDLRDYVENGDLPPNERGEPMDVDRGEYGDRAVRDYNDYSETYQEEIFD